MQAAFDELLAMFDAAYADLRAMAADQVFLNTNMPEYKAAREKFEVIQENIFRFKYLWIDLKKTTEKQP